MAVTPESNLALIEELQELVGAKTYEPVDGPEFSYPAVGQAVDDEMWKFVTLALGSGVLDQGGRPYWLRKLASDSETNSANQMRLTVSTTTDNAQAVLKGFYHRLLQDMRLDFPMPLSETTYYVVLELNPLKARAPEGPISVQVYPNELNTESGREHLVLWTVTRQPNQLLTEATVARYRPRVVPTEIVATQDQLPDPTGCLWGSLFFVHETAEILMAVGATEESGGPTRWLNLTSPEWTPSTSIAFPAVGHRGAPGPSWRTIGDKVELRGRVKRSDGSDFNPGVDYTLIPNCPDVGKSGVMWSGSDGRRSNPVWMDTGTAGAGVKPTFRVKEPTAWVDLTGFFYYKK